MNKKRIYSSWFLVPALVVFTVFFVVPMLLSFYFSLTVWDFDSVEFCGLDNFVMFLTEPSLRVGVVNTLIYAVLTSGTKVVLAFLIAVFLTSPIQRPFSVPWCFFPTWSAPSRWGLPSPP